MREIVSVTRRSLATALLALSPAVVQQRAALAVQAERVDPVTGKLVLTQPPTIDIRETPPVITSRCFLDVSIGGTPAGRIDIELYGDIAPLAAENFRALCTREKGFGYAGTTFFKILEGIAVQGGDVDGKGLGHSIYGPSFPHDNVCDRSRQKRRAVRRLSVGKRPARALLHEPDCLPASLLRCLLPACSSTPPGRDPTAM